VEEEPHFGSGAVRIAAPAASFRTDDLSHDLISVHRLVILPPRIAAQDESESTPLLSVYPCHPMGDNTIVQPVEDNVADLDL